MVFEIITVHIYPEGGVIAEFDIIVHLVYRFTKGIYTRTEGIEAFANNTFFGYSVNETISSTESGNESIGSTNYFDLFDVVKRTIVLHVITNSITIEILSGTHTTNDRGVTVTFTLPTATATATETFTLPTATATATVTQTLTQTQTTTATWTESQSETLEQLTNSIVNKLMHEPISRLRDETDREAGLVRLEEARSLFGLDGNDLGSGDLDEEASE